MEGEIKVQRVGGKSGRASWSQLSAMVRGSGFFLLSNQVLMKVSRPGRHMFKVIGLKDYSGTPDRVRKRKD